MGAQGLLTLAFSRSAISLSSLTVSAESRAMEFRTAMVAFFSCSVKPGVLLVSMMRLASPSPSLVAPRAAMGAAAQKG